jgi:hypothetical protein
LSNPLGADSSKAGPDEGLGFATSVGCTLRTGRGAGAGAVWTGVVGADITGLVIGACEVEEAGALIAGAGAGDAAGAGATDFGAALWRCVGLGAAIATA